VSVPESGLAELSQPYEDDGFALRNCAGMQAGGWSVRQDPGGLLQVTRPGTDSQDFLGFHLEAKPDPTRQDMTLNKGDGLRLHGIIPGIIRDKTGPVVSGQGQRAVFDYLDHAIATREVVPEELKVYWFLLKPPTISESGEKVFEAIISPTPQVAHDGSTILSDQESEAFLIAVKNVRVGILTSLVGSWAVNSD
jgi:hypothetical protein